MSSNTTYKYCVFWIPCTSHSKLRAYSNSCPYRKEIPHPDNYNEKHTLTVALAAGQADDKLYFTIKSVSKNHGSGTLRLEFEDYSRNGLLECRFKCSPKKNIEVAFIEKVLATEVYKGIKVFFHKHEFHSEADPSIHLAYINSESEPVDIHKADNPALKHYFRQFEQRFIDLYNTLEDQFALLGKDPAADHRRREIFRQNCDNIIGESIYYQALSYSKYNKSCVLSLQDAIDDEMHRIALRINSIVENVRLRLRQNEYAIHTINAQLSIALSRELCRISGDNKDLLSKLGALLEENVKTTERINILTETGMVTNERSLVFGRRSVKLGIWSLFVGGCSILFGILSPILYRTNQPKSSGKPEQSYNLPAVNDKRETLHKNYFEYIRAMYLPPEEHSDQE